MSRFIKKLLLFFVFNLLLTIGLSASYFVYYKITFKDIPPPNFSNSYSYNEKMEFVRKTSIRPDVIAIGSSMSLNNLDSETITKRLQTDSYLNLSSWGMSLKDIYSLLKLQSEIHKPHTLIMSSGIVDFQEVDKSVDYTTLEEYLRSNDKEEILFHLECFNLKYYISKFKYAKFVRSSIHEYEYLGYDKYGAVNFNGKDFHIDSSRWNRDYMNFGSIETSYYSHLDSITTFCKNNNISLLFLESPYRKGLYSKFDTEKLGRLNAHIQKVESIVNKDDHEFINANEVIWDDSLFVDGTHLNAIGAKLFTEYCLNKLKLNKRI